MSSLTKFFYSKSFWGLSVLGLNLAMGQMPFDLAVLAFVSLFLLGFFWTKYEPVGSEAFLWGLGFGAGYFSVTFVWIAQPFLIAPTKHGWLAPLAILSLVIFLSLILSTCFFLAAKLGNGRSKNQKLLILFLFFLSSELIRSEFFLNFPWGLISSMWINFPPSQALALFGPYWLSGLTILSAFLLSRPWVGTSLGLIVIVAVYSFGYARLSTPTLERSNPINIRIVQPNIKQSEKWDLELASSFFQSYLEMSKSAGDLGIDLIIWPETAINFAIQNEKELRNLIAKKLNVPLLLGARRFDKKNKKLYNSAFLLAKNGDILDVYDKIRLVPFGEYIPFGKLLSNLNIFGLATDGVIGFSSGVSTGSFKTDKLGVFKILICYEAIFAEDSKGLYERPNWLVNITNDAWFGSFSGPQQHLTLARMRAIEQGVPMVRSANTGISAIIGPYGRVSSKLNLGSRAYLDGLLPVALQPTLYSRLGPRLWNILLISFTVLTIGILIFIKLLESYRKKH